MPETSIPDTRSECLNCGQPMQGDFCADCGQQEKEVRRPFIVFIQEFIWVVFELDGRAYRTLGNLLTRPGFLTREYFAGRRVKYTPPLRLFLIISIGFFLIISLVASVAGIREEMSAIAGAVTQEEPAALADDNIRVLDGDLEPENYGEVIEVLELVDLPFFDEETNRNLRSVLVTQFETNIQELMEDPRDFLTGSLEYVTFFMLLMMPVLALIQQILWIFSRRYYIEHLVLTVHNHAFVILMIFLAMMVSMIDESGIPVVSEIAGFLGAITVIWIFVYLFLSLKRYFESGWFVTLILYGVASVAYSLVLGMGLVAFALLLVLFA